jgi:multisubunit Na+/H+ antiporter MnhF subunit
MTAWLAAGAALLAQVGLCATRALRGSPMDRLVGLELGSVVIALGLLVLAEGFDRAIYFDLALVFTVLSFAVNLVFVRSLERSV